ncbi:MAG: stage II sporulation protein M [Candidatus Melainabacteria bacterium]|nr:stage II sporulation protein M [Candidatus Melainabacteria bacterium]
MNIERWVRNRSVSWRLLEELLVKIERHGLASLDRQELYRLGRLYRATTADLSRARALSLGGDIPVYLNNLVVKAHNQVYQRTQNRLNQLFMFLWRTFPILVRQNILYIAVAVGLFVMPAVMCYFLVLDDVNFAHLELFKGTPLVSEELWHMIEQHQMWTDTVQGLSPVISSEIAANNIRVALLAFALGVTGGLGTAWLLLVNGMMIGTVFGACFLYGMDYRLLAFVAPHGVLELASIFICGGGGLVLGKALLFPGQLRRADALRLASKPAIGLFVGCLPILLVAGSIEGFVSPRTDVSAEAKFLVSLSTLALLFLYLFLPRRQPNFTQDPSNINGQA